MADLNPQDQEVLNQLVLMLRSRLRLGGPTQQTDPLYQIPDSALKDVVVDAIFAHNPLYTPVTLPNNETQFVLWLAMVEVYYMIATGSAQFYQIQAQGAQLNRQQIFDHFSKLAQQLQDKYDKAWDKFIMQTLEAQSTEIVLERRFTPRNYRLIAPATITLSVTAQTPTSIYLQWTPITDRQMLGYRLYKNTSEIIDEYSPTDDLIVDTSTPVAYLPDIYKTKYRIDNLTAGTIYNFAVYVEDVYGHKCWSELSIQQPTTANPNNAPNPVITTNNSSSTSVN